ncbi:hypothetical protein [Streptosporangium sp. NPDC049078]|uniref:hypothetical protein n=1 Tax=Streptosporangium sp. NPDC049078 TaxID=3155767 RepID=UPI0034423E02
MTRTPVLPEQDALWALPEPAVPAQAAPPPLRKPNRFHTLDLPAPLRGVCNPRCLVCGRDEDDGLCSPCSVVCMPGGGPVEVCLITRSATARPAGDRLVAVTCPWCDRVHWHSALSVEPVRSGQCGRPYVLRTPQAGLRSTQSDAHASLESQGTPAVPRASRATTGPHIHGDAS